jgi:hypothetical protein
VTDVSKSFLNINSCFELLPATLQDIAYSIMI